MQTGNHPISIVDSDDDTSDGRGRATIPPASGSDGDDVDERPSKRKKVEKDKWEVVGPEA
jgi:hypothetical protein